MAQDLRFSIEFGGPDQGPGDAGAGETPIDILVVGDFSARGSAETAQPANDLRLWAVDSENLDNLINRLAPTIRVPVGSDSKTIEVGFHSIEDFHPDSLVSRLTLFNRVDADNDLLNNTEPSDSDKAYPHDGNSAVAEDDTQTVARLLGAAPLEVEQKQSVAKKPAKAKRVLIENIVRRLAEKSNEQVTDQTSPLPNADRIAADTATEMMRALLHAAPFRALEASWRSLDWLVRTIDEGAHTRIFLLDINRQALAAALEESSDLNRSRLYRILNDHFADGVLIIGDYRFGSEPEDIQLLSRLGQLAQQLNGSFIAEADDNIFENNRAEAEDSWRTLRESAAARQLGLAFPRILVRLPYGERSDPIESFPFQEVAGSPTGNSFLWGNPAFACAILSVINRIQVKPASTTVIGDMPAYSYREDGESQLQPCTEKLLSEPKADKILSQGVMPVLGSKNRNIIQIPWLHTLALR